MINIKLVILFLLLMASEVTEAIGKNSDCEDLYRAYPGIAGVLKTVKGTETNIKSLQKEVFAVCKEEALEGNALSQFRLAHMNYYGFAEKQNITEALYWYMQSEKQGVIGSKVMLGQLFMDGKYLGKNIPLAYYWFVKANSDLEVFDKKFCDSFTDDLNSDEIKKIEAKVKSEDANSKLGTCIKEN